jgi:hypothetical protein
VAVRIHGRGVRPMTGAVAWRREAPEEADAVK